MKKALFMLTLTLAFPAVAPAIESDPECRTVTTELVERPDTAVGGDIWALDDLTRTVRICEIDDDLADDGRSFYEATLTDTGTFETVGDTTTPVGAEGPLPAGVTGQVDGVVRFEIVAGSGFEHFDASGIDGQTFTGDDPRSTSGWVLPMFGDNAEQSGDVYASTWHWTYTTCAEKHIQSAENLDGYVGDITGEECPDPEPTQTESGDPEPTQDPATGTPEPTGEPTGDATSTPSPTATADTLPDTGASPLWLAASALVLILAGVGLMLSKRTN